MGLAKTKRELKLIDSDGVVHIIRADPGRTILDSAVDNSVDLIHSCGGMGTCGTCRVRLTAVFGENTPARNEVELEMAEDRNFAPNERLSCQVEIPSGEFIWTAEAIVTDED